MAPVSNEATVRDLFRKMAPVSTVATVRDLFRGQGEAVAHP